MRSMPAQIFVLHHAMRNPPHGSESDTFPPNSVVRRLPANTPPYRKRNGGKRWEWGIPNRFPLIFLLMINLPTVEFSVIPATPSGRRAFSRKGFYSQSHGARVAWALSTSKTYKQRHLRRATSDKNTEPLTTDWQTPEFPLFIYLFFIYFFIFFFMS
jgi:hypothetical protein